MTPNELEDKNKYLHKLLRELEDKNTTLKSFIKKLVVLSPGVYTVECDFSTTVDYSVITPGIFLPLINPPLINPDSIYDP